VWTRGGDKENEREEGMGCISLASRPMAVHWLGMKEEQIWGNDDVLLSRGLKML
jgi:hypothetical protein